MIHAGIFSAKMYEKGCVFFNVMMFWPSNLRREARELILYRSHPYPGDQARPNGPGMKINK